MKKYPKILALDKLAYDVKAHHDFKGRDENLDPIYLNTEPYPTIKFKGTIKIHGANTSIVRYKDKQEFQSRDTIIKLGDDLHGFCYNMVQKNLDSLFEGIEFNEYIAIYGEWFGQGVIGGTAVSEAEKSFCIFGVKVDDEWLEGYDRSIVSERIYNVCMFPQYEIEVDFNDLNSSQAKINEWIAAIEKQCPVAGYLGIEGRGEGIVFTAVQNVHNYQFKGKIEDLKTTAFERPKLSDDVIEANRQFVSFLLTEARLQQGVEYLRANNKPITKQSTGAFVHWIAGDIVDENTTDIIESGLDPKNVTSASNKAASSWFINYINNLSAE